MRTHTVLKHTVTSTQRQAYVHTGVQFSLQAWRLPVSTGGEMQSRTLPPFPKVPILRPESKYVFVSLCVCV